MTDHQPWRDLSTRRGPDADWVRHELQALVDGSADGDAFGRLWPELCSEGTSYDAAYAAASLLVEIARHLPAADSIEYLVVLGLIATCEGDVPADLERGYRRALQDALAMALARLADCPTDAALRYLLAAVAAFRGRDDLASVLQDLDAIQDDCPSCGTVVFPAELQDVVGRDREI